MRFFITYTQPSVEKKALSLSKKLNLELFDDSGIYDTDSFSSDYFLVCKSERLILKQGLRKNAKPIFCDFDDWVSNYDDSLLKKALKGLPKKFSCLDVTAGFGKDSLEISKSNKCHSISLLEKASWMHALLQDGLENVTTPEAKELMMKFTLYNIDNLTFLNSSIKKFDLIYIDPMFYGVQRSKAKKHMQALRDLLPELKQEGLLKECLNSARYRVVVKRHKHMNYLEDLVPTRSVEGKVVRYDLYNIN